MTRTRRDFIQTLGVGAALGASAFGRVVLAQEKSPGKFIADETKKWGDVIRTANVTLD